MKIRTNATTHLSRLKGEEMRSGDTTCWDTGGGGERWVTEGAGRKGLLLAKRKFGEDTRARKPQTLIVEAVQRAWAYDAMACYARARA